MDNDDDSNTSRSTNLVSARLPSLISIEIILLLWYLMGCTPLMLFFWFYLPTHHEPNDLHNILGSIIFVISFVPIYTIHIIRIWLLKLKYNVTSLSMLNQLGMIKWKDIRTTIWTKIYYNHKWSHNIKILIIISIIFDILITIIYSLLLIININHRFYLNAIIFGILTLCLIIGIYSLRSFNDPFNIFREEIIILSVWFIAMTIYFILYYFLWEQVLNSFLSDDAWIIAVTFFGAAAALISIIIHLYFNHKSIKTIQKNLPSLGIIVSTKEGLETFLKFLVTELSVENLEFFTLSMRWRHRLVLRDQRRERRKCAKNVECIGFNENEKNKKDEFEEKPILKAIQKSEALYHEPQTPSLTYTAAGAQSLPVLNSSNNTKKGNILRKLGHISEMTSVTDFHRARSAPKNILTTTAHSILTLQNRDSANEARTHLQQLPFPILTFEFLDRDVVKTDDTTSNNGNGHKYHGRDNTVTETSYVLEFSKTKTMISPGNTQRGNMRLERNITDRETVVSVFFSQYSCMQENKRMITELSKNGRSPSRTLQTPQTHTTHGHHTRFSMKSHIINHESNGTVTPHTNTPHTNTPHTKTKSLSDNNKRKSVKFKVIPSMVATPTVDPMSDIDESMSLNNLDSVDEGGDNGFDHGLTARSIITEYNPQQQTAKNTIIAPLSAQPSAERAGSFGKRGNIQITPYMSYQDVKQKSSNLDEDDNDEFILTATNSNRGKDGNFGELREARETFADHDDDDEMEYDERDDNERVDAPFKKQRSATVQSIVVTAADDDDDDDDMNDKENEENEENDVVSNIYGIIDKLSVINTGSRKNKEINNKNDENHESLKGNLKEKRLSKSKSTKIGKKEDVEIDDNTNTKNGFCGWFDVDNNFDIYDEEWTEEFMRSKRVDYDRFNTLSEEINISANARNNLRNFFNIYPTVRTFKEAQISEYDNMFEMAWKDVWQNLNDSLRRFHQSKYYKQWLQSNAANGLNVIPMH